MEIVSALVIVLGATGEAVRYFDSGNASRIEWDDAGWLYVAAHEVGPDHVYCYPPQRVVQVLAREA